jgi:primosomal protein N' (replication factor Y) (superfamily II helicase)
MRILTVIPIAKAIQKDTLTYFTKADIEKGSIVSIPLRKKHGFGLVVDSLPVENVKSEIKNLPYNIRKVSGMETHAFLSPSFIRAAEKLADYYAASVGSVLSVLIPSKILENSGELSYTPVSAPATPGLYETVLLQSDDEERYANYKSLIREEFARGHSIFFCLPTTEDLLNARHTLEKGIETYTFTMHAGLSNKEIVGMWKRLAEEPHPVLIIGTGSFLSLPRADLSTIILEKESSRGYKMQSRPFIDIRTAAEILAREKGCRLVLGDALLRTETLWEHKNGTYAELAPLKFRSLSSASCELISMRKPAEAQAATDKREFSLLSDKLKETLRTAKEHTERTFLFAGRKGLSPTTVCSDCGTVVTCSNCNAPVVLYGRHARQSQASAPHKAPRDKNLFVCHHCGERRDAAELCKHCGGWRLQPLGIGTEQVVEEAEKMFPDTAIIMMDKEHISTHKQAVKARDLFYNTPGAIMVGTEMALPYLNQPVENTAVVSLDSLFSIPDFRIHEKVFHILLTLRAKSDKQMLVQTRQEDTRIFDYALRGNLMDFYRDEIEERKMADYPPFTTYIKLTLEGDKREVQKRMDEIAESLMPDPASAPTELPQGPAAGSRLAIFDAFNPGREQKFTMHGLLTMRKGEWPDATLLSKLRALPPYVMIKVDPDTLL